MITVELDIFSGRPNPRWTLTSAEGGELIDRLRSGQVKLRRPDDAQGILGYRGLVVSVTGEHASSFTAGGLPTSFRLCDDASIGSQVDTRLALLRTTNADAAVPAAAMEVAAGAIVGVSTKAPLSCTCTPTPAVAAGTTVAASTCSYYLTGSFDFSFWNGSAHITKNNCYNYASNWRTDTFAQPGRGSGQTFSAMTVNNILAAARRDGYSNNCSPNCLAVVLVVWPNTDYHWYRYTWDQGQANWTHKPGTTPARNTDNSGKLIPTPYICDRGNYTLWGGNLYSPGSARTTVK